MCGYGACLALLTLPLSRFTGDCPPRALRFTQTIQTAGSPHNSHRGQKTVFVLCPYTHFVLAFVECTTGDETDARSVQEETKSNLFRPDSTHRTLTSAHHYHQTVNSTSGQCHLCRCPTRIQKAHSTTYNMSK